MMDQPETKEHESPEMPESEIANRGEAWCGYT